MLKLHWMGVGVAGPVPAIVEAVVEDESRHFRGGGVSFNE